MEFLSHTVEILDGLSQGIGKVRHKKIALVGATTSALGAVWFLGKTGKALIAEHQDGNQPPEAHAESAPSLGGAVGGLAVSLASFAMIVKLSSHLGPKGR